MCAVRELFEQPSYSIIRLRYYETSYKEEQEHVAVSCDKIYHVKKSKESCACQLSQNRSYRAVKEHMAFTSHKTSY